MESKTPFLKLTGISKTFPGVKALDNVQLELLEGEVHALMGENGAGKSTLIKILAGVLDPDEGGQIVLDGEPVRFRDPLDALQRGISVIYQDLSLFTNLTVAENITFGTQMELGAFRRVHWKKIREQAQEALDQLGMELDLRQRLSELSIAKQQMVAIARALQSEARLIIMDEPTSSLSSSEIELLYQIIETLKEKNIAVLFISHKFQEVFKVADRITVLRDGQYISTDPIEKVTEDSLVQKMVGRSILFEPLNEKSAAREDTVLEVRNLSRKGQFHNISLELKKGEILGITGLVGAGRSELAQAVFGLNAADSGEVLIEGEKVVFRHPSDAIEKGIAYVPENRKLEGLVLSQSISRNITIPILKRIKTNKLLDLKREQQLGEKYIADLDIRPADPNRLTGELSGGNQQKVVIGKWLAAEPKVLIVDEPTNGVDIGAKVAIHKLLRQLAADGLGIILISSELPEVLTVSDRILVMRLGRLVAELDVQGTTQETILEYALGERQPEEGRKAL